MFALWLLPTGIGAGSWTILPSGHAQSRLLPVPERSCDGRDDDGDGAIDEGCAYCDLAPTRTEAFWMLAECAMDLGMGLEPWVPVSAGSGVVLETGAEVSAWLLDPPLTDRERLEHQLVVARLNQRAFLLDDVPAADLDGDGLDEPLAEVLDHLDTVVDGADLRTMAAWADWLEGFNASGTALDAWFDPSCVAPGEICDGLDQDGDGEVDEACLCLETCDGWDNDQDGVVDESPDEDGDGLPDCYLESTGPVAISDLEVTVEGTRATVRFVTDQPAQGGVNWGEDGLLTATSRPGPEGTVHEVVVDGLYPRSEVLFRPWAEADGARAVAPPVTASVGDPDFSVVVVLMDDMRFDWLWALPETMERMSDHGVQFERAYTTVPLCCPFRGSLLAGGFLPQDTGVLANHMPNGGALRFSDADNLGFRLQQEAGWKTALIGRYMHEYDELDLRIPPGWDRWRATRSGDLEWTDYTVWEGSSGAEASTATERTEPAYVTDYLFTEALDFLASLGDEPFFLYLSQSAPHFPADYLDEDAERFEDYTWRGRSYNEEDVSDKPAEIADLPLIEDAQATRMDDDVRARLRSLQPVDRWTAALFDELEALGRLDRTIIVLTSDNGYLFGEHRVEGKGLAYEESVRVPLVVRVPGVAPRSDDHLVAVNLDLAATLMDLAGLENRGQGQSLLPLLYGHEPGTWRDHLILQTWRTEASAWAGVVGERFKYVAWETGEEEF